MKKTWGAVGFKLFPDHWMRHNECALQQLLGDTRVKKIILKRENVLDVYISKLRSDKQHQGKRAAAPQPSRLCALRGWPPHTGSASANAAVCALVLQLRLRRAVSAPVTLPTQRSCVTDAPLRRQGTRGVARGATCTSPGRAHEAPDTTTTHQAADD